MNQQSRSVAASSTEELQLLLEGDRQSLRELEQFRGTPAGDRGIADTKHHMGFVERELARRAEGGRL